MVAANSPLGGNNIMKIHVERLGKTFDVKPTNKVIRSVYQYQLDSAKLSDVKNKKAVEIFSNAIAQIDRTENFLSQTLGLSKKESEKLDDEFELNDISEMANYVAQRLMGMSDEDIKESEEKSSEGTTPKK